MPRANDGWDALSAWRRCVITTTAASATDKRSPVNPLKRDPVLTAEAKALRKRPEGRSDLGRGPMKWNGLQALAHSAAHG
jgi:hypothetical protein